MKASVRSSLNSYSLIYFYFLIIYIHYPNWRQHVELRDIRVKLWCMIVRKWKLQGCWQVLPDHLSHCSISLVHQTITHRSPPSWGTCEAPHSQPRRTYHQWQKENFSKNASKLVQKSWIKEIYFVKGTCWRKSWKRNTLLNLHHGLKGGISRVGKLKMPNRGKTDNAMWNGGTKEISVLLWDLWNSQVRRKGVSWATTTR